MGIFDRLVFEAELEVESPDISEDLFYITW